MHGFTRAGPLQKKEFHFFLFKPCLKDLAVLSFYLATLSEPLLWATLSITARP